MHLQIYKTIARQLTYNFFLQLIVEALSSIEYAKAPDWNIFLNIFNKIPVINLQATRYGIWNLFACICLRKFQSEKVTPNNILKACLLHALDKWFT